MKIKLFHSVISSFFISSIVISADVQAQTCTKIREKMNHQRVEDWTGPGTGMRSEAGTSKYHVIFEKNKGIDAQKLPSNCQSIGTYYAGKMQEWRTRVEGMADAAVKGITIQKPDDVANARQQAYRKIASQQDAEANKIISEMKKEFDLQIQNAREELQETQWNKDKANAAGQKIPPPDGPAFCTQEAAAAKAALESAKVGCEGARTAATAMMIAKKTSSLEGLWQGANALMEAGRQLMQGLQGGGKPKGEEGGGQQTPSTTPTTPEAAQLPEIPDFDFGEDPKPETQTPTGGYQPPPDVTAQPTQQPQAPTGTTSSPTTSARNNSPVVPLAGDTATQQPGQAPALEVSDTGGSVSTKEDYLRSLRQQIGQPSGDDSSEKASTGSSAALASKEAAPQGSTELPAEVDASEAESSSSNRYSRDDNSPHALTEGTGPTDESRELANTLEVDADLVQRVRDLYQRELSNKSNGLWFTSQKQVPQR